MVRRLRASHPDWQVLRLKHHRGACGFDTANDCYEGDLRDSALLHRIFTEQSVDHVIHAASQSYNHAGYRAYPFQVIENDTASLLNLLRHCSSARKLVYLSSALLYEHSDVPSSEEDGADRLPAPTSSFGAAKRFGEQAIQAYGREHGVDFTIWRPFNIVSPLEPHQGDGRHVFVDFFRRLFVERVADSASSARATRSAASSGWRMRRVVSSTISTAWPRTTRFLISRAMSRYRWFSSRNYCSTSVASRACPPGLQPADYPPRRISRRRIRGAHPIRRQAEVRARLGEPDHRTRVFSSIHRGEARTMTPRTCALCGGQELRPVIDLGFHPCADTFVFEAKLSQVEPRFPLGSACAGNAATLSSPMSSRGTSVTRTPITAMTRPTRRSPSGISRISLVM